MAEHTRRREHQQPRLEIGFRCFFSFKKDSQCPINTCLPTCSFLISDTTIHADHRLFPYLPTCPYLSPRLILLAPNLRRSGRPRPLHNHQFPAILPRIPHPQSPLVQLRGVSIAREQYGPPQLGPLLQHFVETLHHPGAQPFALVLRQDVDVGYVPEGYVVGD